MDQRLLPVPRVWLRAALFGGVLALLPFAGGTWTMKLLGVALWALVLGSYRDARIEGGAFQHGFVVGFVPLKPRRVKLERCIRLGIDLEEGAGIGWVFVIGGLNWLLVWLLDWLFPWLGGRYRVWLVTAKGRKILAWQGNSDAALQANLAMLESATGLTTERTGFSP